MKIIKILFIVALMFVALSIATSQEPNIDYTYPNDNWVDRILDLNQSGNNMTADEFIGGGRFLTGVTENRTLMNNSNVGFLNISGTIFAGDYFVLDNKVLSASGFNTIFHSDTNYTWLLDGNIAMLLIKESPASLTLFNASLNVNAASFNVYSPGDPLMLKDLTNIIPNVNNNNITYQVKGITTPISESKGTYFYNTGYLDEDETDFFPTFILIQVPGFCNILPTFCPLAVINPGEHITLFYDGTSIDVFLPLMENLVNTSVSSFLLYVGSDGSTYWDVDLEVIAQPAAAINYSLYIEGDSFFEGNAQTKNLTIENTIRSSKNNAFKEITDRGDMLIWI